ncbi:PhoH family protein [Corynebacterium caspium]|uniref:PhoH family protein n=1 Tax=Corynebacterium caspium TaxID=234828 RepID=UPI000363981C|nr:PhoH family protein [Corynebacterium caspium]WKD58894.1 PhoH-like protein [Corynebacterium caspium DSM 44850]
MAPDQPLKPTPFKSPVVSASVDLDSSVAQRVLGPNEAHVRILSNLIDSDIFARGSQLKITGPGHEVQRAKRVIKELAALATRGQEITPDTVKHAVNMVTADLSHSIAELAGADIISRRGKVIRPKTAGQLAYVEAIDEHTITFGIGPAGSGKTYLAMAKAVQALQAKEVARIILTRPAVEAGEKLGFLPGTLGEKIDPYLRPLHDALRDMVDPEVIPKLMESGIVEVAPLAYMRGRTLNDAFVILDEAQNTTPEQMKMFLTRLGFGSKMVVTGDITQIDLPGVSRSGLRVVRNILRGVPDIHFAQLSSADVVRHSLVGRIVEAYDHFEEKRGEKP